MAVRTFILKRNGIGCAVGNDNAFGLTGSAACVFDHSGTLLCIGRINRIDILPGFHEAVPRGQRGRCRFCLHPEKDGCDGRHGLCQRNGNNLLRTGILRCFCNLFLHEVYCDYDLALRRDDLFVQLLRRGVQHEEVCHCAQLVDRI